MCQCGIKSKRSPIHSVWPGSMFDCTLTSVTVTCSVETVAGSTANMAGGARINASSSAALRRCHLFMLSVLLRLRHLELYTKWIAAIFTLRDVSHVPVSVRILRSRIIPPSPPINWKAPSVVFWLPGFIRATTSGHQVPENRRRDHPRQVSRWTGC